MDIIHMEVEAARDAALHLEQDVTRMQDLITELKGGLFHLDWSGETRDVFVEQFEKMTNEMAVTAEDGFELACRLHREINEWEEADAEFDHTELSLRLEREEKYNIAFWKYVDADSELKQAEKDLKEAKDQLFENVGVAQMEWIMELLEKFGIPPIFREYLAFNIYAMYGMFDATGIPAIFDALKLIITGEDPSIWQAGDFSVVAKEGGIGLSVLGNVWKSIKEVFNIGDAVTKYGEFDEALKAYETAMDNYLAAVGEARALE